MPPDVLGGLTAALPDLSSLGSALGSAARESADVAARAARAAAEPMLLASATLSPLTGGRALSALTSSAARLSTSGTEVGMLGLGVRAAADAYTSIDTALAGAASTVLDDARHALDGTGDMLGEAQDALGQGARTVARTASATWDLLTSLAREQVDAELATLTAGAVWMTLKPYLTAGLLTTYAQNLGQTYGTVLSDPFSPGTYPRALRSWSDAPDELLHNTVGATAAMPDGAYALTLRELPFLMDRLGFHDHATLTRTSVVPQEKLASREAFYLSMVPDASVRATRSPADPTDLAYTMGTIDAMGAQDEAVIRVLRKDTPSGPAFTLVIPSTKDWSPLARVPNDVTGNLHIMTGDSALLRASHEALTDAMADAGVSDPRRTKVMIAGFSQGGITAAAFSRAYQDDFRIEQVMTLGAPIGRTSDIPARTHVLAYEFDDDLVPRLDHASNPDRAGWETVHLPGGRHNAALYGDAARAHPPAQPNRLSDFLSDGDELVVTDFYATRERR